MDATSKTTFKDALRRAKAALPAPIRRPRRWLKQQFGPLPLFQRTAIELQSHCNRTCFFCPREADTTGMRKYADGRSHIEAMPTEKVMSLLDELQDLGFKNYITFHSLSEAFLDKRLMTIAREAKARGMKPYIHTNGDVLRNNEKLCAEAAQVFDYIVVGLYDYTTEEEKEAEKIFWHARLKGTEVMFSLAFEFTYARTYSPGSQEMEKVERRTYPGGGCGDPMKRLLIHYNGDIAYCCEDAYGELSKLNVFSTSLKEAWYGAHHRRIARDLMMGERHKYDLCAKCTMAPSGYSDDAMTATNRYDR